jgi:ABC-type transporter Mla subunit MlaD
MPQFRRDLRGLTELADIYADAAPDLFDGLASAAVTAGTLHDQRTAVDDALMAAIGFSGTAGDILDRGGPYLVRGAQDLIPTATLFDYYSPQLFCTIRNYHDAAPLMAEVFGGDNGYSLASAGTIFGMGVPNTYVFPDNLPRVNARGGPPRPRAGRATGLLAEDHPRAVAGTVPGDGHRVVDRALQPLRTGPADLHRVCMGPPDRCAHHQSLSP